MKKKGYLDLLEEVLRQNSVSVEECRDILEDYEELYDGYLERGMSDEEIKEKLGSPYNVVASLKGTMHYEKKITKPKEKFIAVSPFIALLIFFIFGFGYDIWHPTWLVFFLIPMSAIVFSMKEGIWHLMTAISPFIATAFFILFGFYTGVYNPTWMVFLLILVFAFLTMNDKRKYLYLGLLLVSSALYLWIGLAYEVYGISLLLFLPLLAVLSYYGHVEVKLIGSYRKPIGYVVITTLVVYFLGGYFYDLWDVLWLVFLTIPVVAIYIGEKGRSRYIAMTPFVSVTIFFLLGYFLDLWQFSWLAFLLIPIVAILIGDE
ncbi:MAG: DUF1700 domain-containing protein [Candidatus Izemoplasmataceae bacterium]